MRALIVIVVSALLICIGAVEESIQPSLSSTADLNSFTGSNNSFTKITSVYPKEVQNTEFIGPSATGAASGATPARIYDFYYPSGVGVGGTKGKKGGDGFCVAVAFNPRLQQPFSLEKFPYTGKPTEFIVPTAHPVVGIISMITFRCWGGGGGSGGTASYGNLSAENITAYASGGGGAFAQATVLVKQGDAISVIVAGGGTSSNGQKGGKGGYGGGGDGGRGYEGSTGGGHGGGGGGGSSSITRSGVLLINAAGGAGAGSSRDCCADGGGAGGALGSSGSVPTLGFSDVSLSSAGKGYVEGDESRRQLYIVQPYSESGSTSAVAAQSGTAGAGGGTKGGTGGSSGSYAISSTGGVANIKSGSSAVFNQAGGYDVQAFPGLSGSGGAGASGLNGGGGGGGGAFGGGGGGSGINGAGGGGGSSYAIQSTSSLTTTSSNANCTIVVDYVNNTCAHVTVTLPLTKTTQGVTKFNLELSNGYVSDEYIKVATILPDEITEGLVNTTGVHVLCGLDPKTPYSIRAVPYVLLGRGFRSNRATFTTLADPFNNYWEPIVPRRVSKGGIGRGFTDSVMNFPNLDVGVEVYTRGTTPANRPAPDNPRSIPRYADPSTTGHPAFPSARKGHSLSTYGDKVYMFGGRSNGYTCAYAYTDILNLGSVQAGREIYPCTNYQPEVQELWTLDVVTYEWELISTANYSTFNNVTIVAYNITPPAREQHTATVAGNYLYIFGGKTDIFISDNATADKLVPLDNYFYNDIWKLELPSHQYFGLNYSMNSEGYGVLNSSGQYIVPIPQNQLLYLTINGSEGNNIKTQGNGVSPREGKCINKIQVKVSIYHPCINQLKIFITGPGDLTGSANYQPSSSDHMVILFDTPETNGTGCSSGLHNFIFDDDSERLTYTCCTSIFSGVYQPNGRINEYLGYSTSADWVLTVQDTVDDLNTGYVVSWGIDFTVSNCVIEYNWINVTSAIMPSPRYHASSLVFGSSIFYFGGRDEYDSPLTDLYRFDTISGIWTELTPMNFGDSLLQASSVGCNLVLTPYGLLRFGGYLRKSSLSMNNEHYVRNVYLLDVVTLRWIELFVSDWDLYDGSLNTAYPPGRYLSAMTFISRKQIQFPNVGTAGSTKTSHYRALFDIRSPSTHTNYVGDIADSVLLYGGFNGAVGSTYDGSGAGLLSDTWMLRLSNFSTNSSTATQQLYLQNSCAWRFSSDTAVPFSSPKSLNTCLGTVNAPCSLREILLLSWCSSNYQAT